jgi:hypothetical protein
MVFRWWYDELKSFFHKILHREHGGQKDALIKATCFNAVNAWLTDKKDKFVDKKGTNESS